METLINNVNQQVLSYTTLCPHIMSSLEIKLDHNYIEKNLLRTDVNTIFLMFSCRIESSDANDVVLNTSKKCQNKLL